MPNLLDKTVRGDWRGASATNIGYSTPGQLPAVAGRVGLGFGYGNTSPSNPFYTAPSNAVHWYPEGGSSTTNETQLFFDLKRSKSAYSRSDNIVIPNSLTMQWVIKY